MKWILIIIFSIFSISSYAKTLKIAVIDTGIKSEFISKAKLCKEGHKSFVSEKYTEEIRRPIRGRK